MRTPLAYLNCAAPNPTTGAPCIVPCYEHTDHEDAKGNKWTGPPGPNCRPYARPTKEQQ